MVNAQKITSNTGWYLIALVAQKLFSFVYFTFLARHLGPTYYGQYQLAINFAMMLSVIADFGLSAVLIREIAKKQIDEQKLFSQIFSLKIILTGLTLIIGLLTNQLLYAHNPVNPLIYLTVFILAIDSFTLLFYGFIRGQQNLFFESIGTILFQIIILALGLTVMSYSKAIYPFVVVMLIASLFNFFYSATLLWRKYKLKLSWSFDKDLNKKIFHITWPFALSALFAKVYAYIDSLILEGVKGSTQLGFYSVAYKVTFAFQFIPLAFVAALYPAFAHYWQNDKEQLDQTLVKAMHYLSFIAWPLSLGLFSIAPIFVSVLYTKNYLGSVLPLQILILSLPFLFVNFALSYFLNATDRQKKNTINLGLTMLFNIILNVILIPLWSAVGASLASSLSTVFLFSLNLYAVSRVAKLQLNNWWPIFKTILAAVLMALAVYFLGSFLSLFVNIFVAIVLYLLLMILFKNLSKAEWQYLRQALKRN